MTEPSSGRWQAKVRARSAGRIAKRTDVRARRLRDWAHCDQRQTDEPPHRHTRPDQWVIQDDCAPQKPLNPLKTNSSKKRRNHRQKSSKVVKTELNYLFSLNNE